MRVLITESEIGTAGPVLRVTAARYFVSSPCDRGARWYTPGAYRLAFDCWTRTLGRLMIGGRVATRLVCLLAVLSGLFFMHGLSGGTECHGAASAMVHDGHPGMAMAHGASAEDQSALARNLAHQMGMCVSTLPTWHAVGLLLLALAAGWMCVAHGSAPRGRLSGPAGRAGRAPPLAGVVLLHRLCISRT